MSVPKKRSASRARKTRASHHALGKVTTVTCGQCKKAIRPHTACSFCGYYKGRNVNETVKTPTTKPKAASDKIKSSETDTKTA